MRMTRETFAARRSANPSVTKSIPIFGAPFPTCFRSAK
jgi:hypothetical protein